MTDRRKNRIGKSFAAMLLVMALVVGMIPNSTLAAENNNSVPDTVAKVADSATITTYTESLGDDASTEYAGRIWTDKSVYESDAQIVLKTGETQTVENDADFLVAYSALATGLEIEGHTTTPMDVVFVIDMSGSMNNNTMDNGRNRLYNATVALNNAMKTLVALNDYVRIGVVSYNRTGYTMLPLDHYEQIAGKEFFTCSGNTITINAKGTEKTYNDTKISTQSGTNIQKGIYDGMNMLASEPSTTVNINGKEVQRIPSLVLLTDGEPSCASDFDTWWDLSTDTNAMSNRTPAAIYGMKALMTASYMKDAIDRNYGGTGNAAAKVYSIGVGIEKVSSSYRPMAYATINPSDETLKNSTNTMVRDMRSTWEKYAGNQTATLGGYTFRHPDTGYDIVPSDKDISGLYYVDEYYKVEDANTMTDTFTSIVTSISLRAAEVPTEMKSTNAIDTGFIYYTDPVGEYMEVKDIKGIIYDGKYYTAVTKNADGTYTVSAEVETELYGKQNLSNIDIKVTGNPGNQTLEIDIPAALIPLRINSVELNADETVKAHINNGSYPIRVIYSVGLVNGLITEEGAVDTTKLDADYLAANTDAEGNVSFYSNLYTGERKEDHEHTRGNATVEFEPSHSNPFYYMQENVPIYTDAAGTNQVSASTELADNTNYYYSTEYYHGTSVETEIIERTGAQLKKTELIAVDGYWYRKAGSPRLNRILEFAGNKTPNVTGTAEDFYYPTFEHAEGNPDPAAGKYVIYLGNNGKMSIPATGALEISKSINVAEGLEPDTTEFEFAVNFNGENTLEGTYNYEIVGTHTTGTITDGGKLTLKAGETARIIGLAPGTTYEVTEESYSGFTTTVNGATGTITAGATEEAKFVNTYEVEAIVYPPTGDEGFTGTKVLEGRAWGSADEFRFLLTPYNNAPLPAGYDPAEGVVVTKPDVEGGKTATFDFGKITFTEPGVYRYTIVEREPAAEKVLPGMTYSRALYNVEVTVTDNGDGTMSAVSEIQKLYSDEAEQLFTYDSANNIVMNQDQEAQDSIVFTNTYEAETVTRVPVATKTYTDTTGARPLDSGMFTFQLKAVGYYDGNNLNKDITNVPMPEGAVNGVSQTTNEGANVTFPHVTFTQANLNVYSTNSVTFRYELTEVKGNIPGMIYDESVVYADVTVSIDDASQELSVVVKYTDENGTEIRVPNFTNTFDPADANVVLMGTKTFSADEALTPDEATFTFRVEAVNEAAKKVLSVAETTSVTMAKGTKTFSFREFIFTQPGVYVFDIKENIGNVGGVTYDTHTTVATVTVTESEGVLTAAVSYDNGDGSAAEEAKFTNVYEADPVKDTTVLSGVKELTGKPLMEGEFFFEVQDMQTNTSYLLHHEADLDGDGKAVIRFPEEAVFTEPGTYNYIIKEQIPVNPVIGNNYDTTEYKYTVVVADDGAGKLEIASRTLVKLANTGSVGAADVSVDFDQINFYNSYKPDALVIDISPMHKVMTGGRTDVEANEFKFKLSLLAADPADGITLPGVTEVTNDADGYVDFGEITFHKAGSYTIQVEEVIPDGAVLNDQGVYELNGVRYTAEPITATYEVTDNRIGTLTARIASSSGTRTFTNTYGASEVVLDGKTNLEVTKKLTGRDWFDNDAFEFELSVEEGSKTAEAIAAGNIVMPNVWTVTITKDNVDGKGAFGDITFKVPGEYEFFIKEIVGNIDNITYNAHSTKVIVGVEDNLEGELVVAAASYVGSMTYENIYTPDEISVHIGDEVNGVKQLNGRTMADDEFTFSISKAESSPADTPMPVSTVTTNKDGKINFGTIEYTKAGTYIYTIKEEVGALPGFSYDEGTVTVVVEVAYDSATGKLSADVSYTKNGGNGGEGFTFVNEYTTQPTEPVNITVQKAVTPTEGNAFAVNGEDFEFEIEPASTNPQPDPIGRKIVENTVDGAVAFITDARFAQAGTYVYTIHEVDGNRGGIIYDDSVYTVTVVVADNEANAQLEADIKVTKDGNPVENGIAGIRFENQYDPAEATVIIHGHKTLDSVHKTLETGAFQFKLSADTETPDAPMPAAGGEVATNAETGLFQFGVITFESPGTYIYEVSEVNLGQHGYAYATDVYEVKVTVTDVDGVLTATTEGIKTAEDTPIITFVNKYEPDKAFTEIQGLKKLTVPEGSPRVLQAGEFTFKLLDENADLIGTATNDADGVFKFTNVEFSQAGTYNYKILEQHSAIPGVTDDPVKEIAVKIVVEDVAGMLQATVLYPESGVVFTNTYNPGKTAVQLSTVKVLEGRDLAEGEFTFRLTDAEDNQIDEKKNTADGTVIFDEIEYTEEGTYEYKVFEVAEDAERITYDSKVYHVTVTVKDGGEGYLVATVVHDEETIVFRNYYDAPEPIVTLVKKQALNAGDATTDPLKANAGDEITYYLQVSNADGAGTATSVTVTDKVPEGLEVLVISGNGVNTDGVITWNFSSLAAGESKTVYFIAKVPTVAEDTVYENAAQVTYKDPADPENPDDPSDPEDSNKVVTEQEAPDAAVVALKALKNLEGRTMAEGEFTFRLTDAEGNIIDEATNDKNGVVTFKEIEYAAEGTFAYKIFEVKGNAEYVTYDEKIYDVTVKVWDGKEGSLVADVEHEGNTIIFRNVFDAPETNVSIVKTQAVNGGNATTELLQVKAGDVVTYYIKVVNGEGADTATNLTIVDKVPAGLELVSISADGINNNGVITWNIAEMAGGESRIVYFSVKVPVVEKDTTYENIAQVTYKEQDDPTVPDDTPAPEDSNEVVIEEKVPVPDIQPEEPEDDTPEPQPEEPKVDAPNTGDDNNLIVWVLLLVASVLGIACVAVRKRRKV